jgi:hypothetical protein
MVPLAGEIGHQDRYQPALDAFSIAELIHMILALVEHAILHDVGQVLALAVEQ